jgi:RNA polymerase subunit RPABC4/transcription elongation factor Spt4
MNEKELKAAIKRLRKENRKIRKDNDGLRKENEKLKKEFDKIKEKFEEYKKRHPKTTGVKHGKSYFFKSSTRSKKQKKPGAKKGHKPHFRPMPEQIDETRRIPVVVCPICGGTDLSENVQEIRERIYEDIPVNKPIVLRLEIERRYCRTCKKIVEAPVTCVLPGARLSLRVMLIATWFKIKLRMTEAAIPEVLYRLFGLKICEGEVIHILSQVAKAFGPYYEQLIQDIRNALVRYIDETTWRINGENVYLWAFVTKWESVYKIAASRGHEVPLKVLGGKHNGVDVHDRFSAYKTLAKKTKNPQQDCWTHIINNAEELAKFYGEEGKHIHQVLKKTYESAKAYDHKGTDEDIEKLFQDMVDELNISYKSQHCHKFVVNLLKEKDNLFEFVKNPYVDGTNNMAERAMRPPVVARKISGGSRSQKGSENYEILLSVTQTIHKKGKNLVEHGPEILLTSYG